MADPFASHQKGLQAPADSCAAVTPANSDLANTTRALYIGTAGDVALILANDSAAVTFKGVPAGTILPVRAKQVRSTGTTAADIVALF